MKRIRLFIPIEPIGQGRPRFTVIKSKRGLPFVSTYDPPESARYKKLLQRIAGEAIISQSQLKAVLPLAQPMAVGMTFYLSRKRMIGEKGQEREIVYRDKYPTALYDLDNLRKAVQDAFNGVLWRDDKLICGDLPGGKYFAEGGQAPGVEIVVEPFGADSFMGRQAEFEMTETK